MMKPKPRSRRLAMVPLAIVGIPSRFVLGGDERGDWPPRFPSDETRQHRLGIPDGRHVTTCHSEAAGTVPRELVVLQYNCCYNMGAQTPETCREDDPRAATRTGLDAVRVGSGRRGPAANRLPLGERTADAAGAPDAQTGRGFWHLLG